MPRLNRLAPTFLLLPFVAAPSSQAAIVGLSEDMLSGDTAGVIELGGFGEDALTFSDRTHEHNGAAFNSGTGLLSTSGDLIIGLPDYLVGNDYIRFANNARDNVGYTATVSVDIESTFYLLVDNRLDGSAGNTSSPNSTDPVLAGTLQWIVDEGWTRVNTGISPDGQADYAGVDEGGNGAGAGMGLNQFYAIYSHEFPAGDVVLQNQGIGGSNMYSVVVAPIPEPGTYALLAGLAALGLAARRRRRSC